MDELEPVKPIPYSREIPIPELGPDAFVTVVNPWMLPIDGEPPTNDPEEERRRGKRMLQRLVPAWRGVYDIDTGKELPAPREDPDVYDRCPRVIHRKVRQAIDAMDIDMEWDPMKRPTPPSENDPTTDSPTKSENSSPSQTTSERTPLAESNPE